MTPADELLKGIRLALAALGSDLSSGRACSLAEEILADYADGYEQTKREPEPIWVTECMLREVAIRVERAIDEDAEPDAVQAETIAAVRAWWFDVIEGGGSDWDEYGEKFVDRLVEGYQRQVAYDERCAARRVAMRADGAS